MSDSSGLPILFERDAALPLVHASVCTTTGASEDPPGQEGLTRLCGRLMRRTAGGRSIDDNDARVDRMGASLGVDCSHTNSSISGSVLQRSFPEYLALLEETIAEPGFCETELERLKRETLAELVEVLDSDQHLAQRWFARTLFAGHPYGRTVVGNAESLKRIDVEDIKRCHHLRFCREQLLFSFAGATDIETCRRASEALWRRLPPAEVEPTAVPEPAFSSGRSLVFVDKPDRSQTQILIGCLGSHPQDSDHFGLLLANTVFGGTFTARLTQEVRAKRGWSYGAYSSLPYDQKRHAFSMWTFPKAGDAASCIALQLDLLSEWWESGVTEEELAWAKQYLVQSQAFSCDTTAKRIGLVLDAALSDLPSGYYERYSQSVEAVTVEEANASIKNRLALDQLVISVVGTHGEIGAAVEQALPNLASVRVVPFDTD